MVNLKEARQGPGVPPASSETIQRRQMFSQNGQPDIPPTIAQGLIYSEPGKRTILKVSRVKKPIRLKEGTRRIVIVSHGGPDGEIHFHPRRESELRSFDTTALPHASKIKALQILQEDSTHSGSDLNTALASPKAVTKRKLVRRNK
jgi:hypothetical protein